MLILLDLVVITVTVTVGTLLSIIVLLNNPRHMVNRIFFMLSASVSSWSLTNYFTDHSGDLSVSLIFARLAFATSFSILIFFYLFINELYADKHAVFTRNKIFPYSLLLFIWVLCLSPYLVLDAHKTNQGVDLTTGFGYLIYLPVLILVFGLIIRSIIHLMKLRDAKRRQQGKIILIGTSVAFTLVFITNILLPAVLGSWVTTKLGPLSTLILLLVFSYVIVRHNLLNIRSFVIRAATYSLSVGIVSAFFILLAFNLTSLLFQGELIPTYLQMYYTVLVLFAVIVFNPIKKYVAKITNKTFYQLSYSVNDAVNKITTYSTTSIDVKKIQENTLNVMSETIKPEFGVFIIYNENKKFRIEKSLGNIPTQILEPGHIGSNLSKISDKITIVGDVDISSRLNQYREAASIGAIIRLSTHSKVIGYLVLGNKKNGNTYNDHDIKLLDLATNDLSLALENAQRYEEIKAFNETLQAKINDATKALKRTNAKLIALDDAKDEFISMASHQLRTPLTSVKGYISMLLEEDLGKINENQKQALKEAFDSSQRMVFLISDFLNVSRMRTGKFLLESKETDLTQIVTEEIQQLKEMAALREQVVVYEPPKKFPIVMLDENKIRQVMMNILDNAIFYTPRNGKITITLESTKEEIIYKVTDEGIGVPEKEQHRLFTKFFRAENARKARPDGTGLGLFMAQKVITEQGGSIIFKSKLGEGSTFGFRFPLEKIRATVDKK